MPTATIIPLMLGTGAGSEIRQPLGYSIVGGLKVFRQAWSYSRRAKNPAISAMQALIGQQLFELGVLLFKRLEPLGLGDLHAAVFALPLVEGRLAG